MIIDVVTLLVSYSADRFNAYVISKKFALKQHVSKPNNLSLVEAFILLVWQQLEPSDF